MSSVTIGRVVKTEVLINTDRNNGTVLIKPNLNWKKVSYIYLWNAPVKILIILQVWQLINYSVMFLECIQPFKLRQEYGTGRHRLCKWNIYTSLGPNGHGALKSASNRDTFRIKGTFPVSFTAVNMLLVKQLLYKPIQILTLLKQHYK